MKSYQVKIRIFFISYGLIVGMIEKYSFSSIGDTQKCTKFRYLSNAVTEIVRRAGRRKHSGVRPRW
jgi:hypothetical protein